MGLCIWGSRWRWDVGLSLMVSPPQLGKAQRPGSVSQGMGTGRRCLHPPQCENRAESRFCERRPASCSSKLALDVWPPALFYEAPALLVLRGSLDAGEGSLMPVRCVAAPPIPS